MTLHAFTDGASRGNPGEAGIGVILKDEQGTVLLTLSGYIGTTTNNVAEYKALRALLGEMKRFPCQHLVVHSDSELMVRQMIGKYKVKDPAMKREHAKVVEAIALLSCAVEFRHVPRERNSDADMLANVGIEQRHRIKI
jgi:ribonuclease HI